MKFHSENHENRNIRFYTHRAAASSRAQCNECAIAAAVERCWSWTQYIFFPTSKWRKKKSTRTNSRRVELNASQASVELVYIALLRCALSIVIFQWTILKLIARWLRLSESHTILSTLNREKKSNINLMEKRATSEFAASEKINVWNSSTSVHVVPWHCRRTILTLTIAFRNECENLNFHLHIFIPLQQHQIRRQSESLLYLKHRENRLFFRVVVISWSARPSVRYQRARRAPIYFSPCFFLRSVFSSLTRSTTSSSSVGMRRRKKRSRKKAASKRFMRNTRTMISTRGTSSVVNRLLRSFVVAQVEKIVLYTGDFFLVLFFSAWTANEREWICQRELRSF